MKILITAGPTREPIDAVRYISNRSSGRLGLALAAASAARGYATTLLLGPVTVKCDLRRCRETGVCIDRFDSGDDLQVLLASHWPNHDVLIMAAAVADFRPQAVLEKKLRRGDGVTLKLVPTTDLVAAMAACKRPDQYVVAFALEDVNPLEQRGAEKLQRKGVDAVVANPLSTIDSDTITPEWITADGGSEAPGVMGKDDFARWLIDKLGNIRTLGS